MDDRQVSAKIADMKMRAVKDTNGKLFSTGWSSCGNMALNAPIQCRVRVGLDGKRTFKWFYEGKPSPLKFIISSLRNRPS